MTVEINDTTIALRDELVRLRRAERKLIDDWQGYRWNTAGRDRALSYADLRKEMETELEVSHDIGNEEYQSHEYGSYVNYAACPKDCGCLQCPVIYCETPAAMNGIFRNPTIDTHQIEKRLDVHWYRPKDAAALQAALEERKQYVKLADGKYVHTEYYNELTYGPRHPDAR